MTGIEVITTTPAPADWAGTLAVVLLALTLFISTGLLAGGGFDAKGGRLAAAIAIPLALVAGTCWAATTSDQQREAHTTAREQAATATVTALEDHYNLDLITQLLSTTGTATTDITAIDRGTGTLLDLRAVTHDGRITLYGDDTGSLSEYTPARQN